MEKKKRVTLDLVTLAQQGDEKAWSEIIDRSEKMINFLAWGILKRININTVDLDDLKQEGRIGLTRAVNSYSDHGFMFETYALPIVRGKMQDFVRDNLPVPRSLLPKLKQSKKLLNENIGDDQVVTCLANAGFSTKNIYDVLFYKNLVIISTDEYGSSFLPEGSYSEVYEQLEAKRMWGKFMSITKSCSCLSDDERLILDSCLGLYKTQRQLANDWGVTESAVSVRKRTIISHLKKCFEQKHRDVYEYFVDL